MLRVTVLLLGTSIALAGQDPALSKLVGHAARIRASRQAAAFKADVVFKTALRDWIEARLPASRATLLRRFSQLQPMLTNELTQAGLLWTDNSTTDRKLGYVERVELSRPPTDLNRLVIIAGVTLACCSDDSVYVYDYSRGARRRLLELSGHRDHDELVQGVYSSTAGKDGNLLLTLRYGAQCGSSWNVLAYDLYRLTGSSVKAIFADQHEIWLDQDPRVRLSPNDLQIEMLDRSIDAGVHSRTYVLHYKVGPKAVERIDPVALQPRDFVEEWLTRPWSEMESRTVAPARDRLKKSHDLLHTDFVAGDYLSYEPCVTHAHRCQIAIEMRGGSIFYFLVHQLGHRRFEMMDVSSTRQP